MSSTAVAPHDPQPEPLPPLQWYALARDLNRGDRDLRRLCLALASYANDEGRNVRPGLARLVDETTLSRATIKRRIDDLITAGFLRRVHEGDGRGNASVYTLTVPPSVRALRGRP